MIKFNKPCFIGTEPEAIQTAISNRTLAGNGPYSDQCTNWLEDHLGCEKALLTPSCTAALEMAALLTEAGPNDEIIVPSYTFVTTANAFVMQGASIRFADIEPETMNISADAVEKAVTADTKAIVIVHYAGVVCDMDAIMEIAERHNLWVIEDAAQALMSTYHDKPAGTIGHLGAFSFHETKNITSGEGGALLINEPGLVERAEIIQEKGTDRQQFAKGKVDKYTWRDAGSSYVLSELNAAYLSVQLKHARQITFNRMQTWQTYYNALQDIEEVTLPFIPNECSHNAHMFFIKTDKRGELLTYLKEKGIQATTHYVPLHTSPAGQKFGQFIGRDVYTTAESEKLLRLPLYYGIDEKDVHYVISHIKNFFTI